ILTAKPYAFLDDAPLEERRTQAVYARRATEPSVGGIGALDPTAIDRVREEARPDPRDADELHDALLTSGYLTAAEAAAAAPEFLDTLLTAHRAAVVGLPQRAPAPHLDVYVAAERLPEIKAIRPDITVIGAAVAPASRTSRVWTHDEALVDMLRSRLSMLGPVTAANLADSLGIEELDAKA